MKDLRKVFEAHGVDFTAERGDESIGTCPFTGKDDKFYVNFKKGVWDSKTAGLGGTIYTFLEEIQKIYRQALTPSLLQKLASSRHLPIDAFSSWEVGWDGLRYTLPVRDPSGRMVDIRLYDKKRVISTAGVSTGLYGSEYLPKHPQDPVFVCEGEWDAIALRWLMRQVDYRGVVVGLPGAGTFKNEWVPWFNGRRVHTLYDNDGPGEEGELKAESKLRSVTQELTFVHWPDGVNDGFDTRDYIVYGAVEHGAPDECWAALLRKFESYPRRNPPKGGAVPSGTGDPTQPSVKRPPSAWMKKSPTYDDVVTVFKKWLYLETTVGIEMTLAVVASQEIEGPPVWVFLVAPPGGGKTEVLSSLIGMDQIYLQSTLTPHALISGANFKGDQDPSLIPRLNGRILVIKDFTSILSMRDAEKDEIFGILRDAYDGRCGKVFGTGIERNYESRFTVLAAVTPRIYDLSQQHHALGERFLKCGVGNNLHHSSERDIIRRAIDNIASDTKMKWELQDVVHAFMKRTRAKELPSLPPEMYDKLIALAMFGSRMRGTVARDTYRSEILTSKPSAEIGSRLGIQLAKLAKSLAWIHGRSVVNNDDYILTKKVMLDTISQRTEDLVRVMFQQCPGKNDYLTTKELAHYTRYPLATIGRIVEDLHILDVVDRIGTSYRYQWTLSRYIRECIAKSELYQAPAELSRPVRRWVRKAKHRGRVAADAG